jgi:ribosomal protein S27AE
MFAIQELIVPVCDKIALRPACPNCGRSMHLARTTQGTDGLLQTYGCGECGVWLTQAAGDQFGRNN